MNKKTAGTAWLDPLKSALTASRPGALFLVEQAHLTLLGELVRELLPAYAELEVHTEARQLLDVPHGSTRVLVPRSDDLDWLQRHPGLLAERALKVILFCDRDVTATLSRQREEGLGGIAQRVRCPERPPAFAVAGIRTALAARAPGILWRGGDLDAAFAAARPHGRLHRVSASLPYERMLEELKTHRRAWIAWTDVDSPLRLRRVRQAHARAPHPTRAILIEPTPPSPGWWPVHGRLAELREARRRLEEKGAFFPGQVAALNELEPEALELTESVLVHGIDAPTVEAVIHFLNAPEGRPDPTLREMGRRYGRQILRGEAEPPVTRVFMSAGRLRALCRTELAALQQQLERGEPVDPVDQETWAAWTKEATSAPPG